MPDDLFGGLFVSRPGYAGPGYTGPANMDPLRSSAERYATADEVAALREDVMSLAEAVGTLAYILLTTVPDPNDELSPGFRDALERAEAIGETHKGEGR